MILVITVIESLRAFDIVYIINKGINGLELLSVLVTNNIIGEASRVGFGSAIAVVLLCISLGPIVYYLTRAMREDGRNDRTTTPTTGSIAGRGPNARRPPTRRRLLHVFLIVIAIVWLFPLACGDLHRRSGRTARRPQTGYVSFAGDTTTSTTTSTPGTRRSWPGTS